MVTEEGNTPTPRKLSIDPETAIALIENLLTEETSDKLIEKLCGFAPHGFLRKALKAFLDGLLPEKLFWALREVLVHRR